MKKYKAIWKEVITYEEIIEAESENQAYVYCGSDPEKVYEDVVDGSLKIERID